MSIRKDDIVTKYGILMDAESERDQGKGEQGRRVKKREKERYSKKKEYNDFATSIMTLSRVNVLAKADGMAEITIKTVCQLTRRHRIQQLHRVFFTSLSPDCSPPYLFVPMASSSSMKIIAPWRVIHTEGQGSTNRMQ
jgi:hypothetical protein